MKQPARSFYPLADAKDRTRLERLGWMLAIVVVVAAIGAAFWYLRWPGSSGGPSLFKVTPGEFTVEITERGELQALDSVTISAQKDLPIIELIPEGAPVQEGDLLVRFDAGKYEVALEEAKAAAEVAQADKRRAEQNLEAQRQKLLADISRFEAEVYVHQLDLQALREMPLPVDLERARIQLEKARVAYKNADKKRTLLPDLLKKGFITRELLEEAELSYLEAKADLQAADHNFDKVAAGATPQELQKAEVRLRAAEEGLEKARAGMESQLLSYEAAIQREAANVEMAARLIDKAEVKLTRTELYAPREGIVVYATVGGGDSLEKVQPGMIPFEGQPLIYLPDLSTMVVDIEINEIDIGKVQVDGPAQVRLEAYPDAIFAGKVAKISSLAKVKSGAGGASGVKAFDVTIQIDEQDERLKPGLSAIVDVTVDRKDRGLFVPLTAVTSRGDRQVVFVSMGKRIEERQVVLGPSNDHDVLITEGLDAGEFILTHAPL